jgi:predicted MFS family arabinose efflux permease
MTGEPEPVPESEGRRATGGTGGAMAAAGGVAGTVDLIRPRLYDARFLTLCSVVLLGFGSFAIIGPVLPLAILDLGGDAALVGLLVAIYSVPSVLLRPFIGRLIDEWSQRNIFLLGTLGLALSSVLYLIPGLWAIAGVRLLHGTAWAAFNTGGNTSLARSVPPSRRAEGSGIYSLMPSVAHMVMPSVGLLIVGVAGTSAAFLLAGTLALVAALVIALGPFPRGPLSTAPRRREGFWRSLIERRALLPMWIEFMWMSVNTLFFVFPPVFAAAKGIPLADLAIYYPIVGGVLIVTRLIIGRRLDRVPRGLPLLAGATCGAVALFVGSLADSVALLTLAGSIYALGSSAVSPMSTALAIDRADPQRRGAAMATYSLGYQLGFGLGAAAWGVVIGALGFPAPFLIGLLAMAGIAFIVVNARRELLDQAPATWIRRS